MGRSAGGGLLGRPLTDTVALGRSGAFGPDLVPNGRGMDFDGRLTVDTPNGRGIGSDSQLPVDAMPRPARATVPLPPDASNTLYVEGLPRDCRKREVARIL